MVTTYVSKYYYTVCQGLWPLITVHANMGACANMGAHANTGTHAYVGFYTAQATFYVCAVFFFLNFYI
jgi:hypothetical protein